jgi:hypothetical protein
MAVVVVMAAAAAAAVVVVAAAVVVVVVAAAAAVMAVAAAATVIPSGCRGKQTAASNSHPNEHTGRQSTQNKSTTLVWHRRATARSAEKIPTHRLPAKTKTEKREERKRKKKKIRKKKGLVHQPLSAHSETSSSTRPRWCGTGTPRARRASGLPAVGKNRRRAPMPARCGRLSCYRTA